MLIVLQNRLEFINLANIAGISISNEKYGASLISYTVEAQENDWKLGTYKNKDRASQILMQIVYAYKRGDRVYEMPEE